MYVRHLTRLAQLTTLGIGGVADAVVEFGEARAFDQVVEFVRGRGGRPVTLGGGSNVLAADDGCRQPVVRVRTRGLRVRDAPDGGGVLITAEAGHPLQELVDTTVAECLTGMETLTGIPGTVGATPVQNVGAYGQEVGDTLTEVQAWDWAANRAVTFDAAACRLGHRSSMFKGSSRWTILRVTFRLTRSKLSRPMDYGMVTEALGVAPGTRVPLAEAAQAVLAVRRAKGMILDPGDPDSRSAGSVFLSPAVDAARAAALRSRGASVHDFPDGSTRVSASWLIRESGFVLNQPLAPGIRVSGKQFTLVAEGAATARAFAEAAAIVAARVERRTGVTLRPELDLFGTEPVYQRLRDRGSGRNGAENRRCCQNF
ncbi:UDP-N-acetylmuramate dehydrogenase [Streptacidiphilus sp. PB12-B1b]|uniref:UDP-N-acetylmuramate dehydrogenase n=1 Tax=Streptacidiphilus sp. PB12-B1b TaxID=2705012 RepID=UPI0015FC4196|nr:UDP-N-acetylmuramate dehydrogenase [Streptacidiphilus sp. PB12-B1b]QMU78807.1 UDP-N-acetylmuramate dehydrogenase [Streptacidiphilus sp. PB12-B1b]